MSDGKPMSHADRLRMIAGWHPEHAHDLEESASRIEALERIRDAVEATLCIETPKAVREAIEAYRSSDALKLSGEPRAEPKGDGE